MMQVKLNQIARRAKQDKRLKFTSLIHHVNEVNLAECYQELKANKACGIDGETVEAYGINLEERLSQLVESMKSKQYRPKPVKRVYIPKAGKNEKRGLGIPSVEDKLVQIMLKKILEQIYEAEFLDVSYGFRPKLSCHDAVKALDKTVMTKPINYIVEVDIKGFFDNVNHYWLQRCLEEKIIDRNLLWLIRKFLKAGVVEDGKQLATEVGTPQGGVISPLISNIFMHYAFDEWMKRQFPEIKFERYVDDALAHCSSKILAEKVLEAIRVRLKECGLELHPDKTRIVIAKMLIGKARMSMKVLIF